jgi:hypothetical protein
MKNFLKSVLDVIIEARMRQARLDIRYRYY